MVFNRGLRGAPLARAVGEAKSFLNFMQFFWKFWQNRMLAPPRPPEGCPPLLRGILDPPLSIQRKVLEWANYVLKNWSQSTWVVWKPHSGMIPISQLWMCMNFCYLYLTNTSDSYLSNISTIFQCGQQRNGINWSGWWWRDLGSRLQTLGALSIPATRQQRLQSSF